MNGAFKSMMTGAALFAAACANTSIIDHAPVGAGQGAPATIATVRSDLRTASRFETEVAPSTSTPVERNLAVIRAYIDAFNRHDFDAAVALWSPDTRNHGRPIGRTGVRMVHEDIILRAPDINFEIQEMTAVDDYVILRALYQGTHLGVGKLPVDGGQLVGVPATGKTFSVQHIHWFTLADGLIVDHRANRDDLGMLVQLGLLPAPPPFPAAPAAGTNQ